MKISKFKLRKELKESIENMRTSGFTYFQCLSIYRLMNSMIMVHENTEQPLDMIIEVVKEVYEQEK